MNHSHSNALTAIAAAAFDKTQPAVRRDAHIARLMEPLRGLAWRLARPDHDLAEELRSHVLLQCERGLYDPGHGPFAAWSTTVMKRRLIAELRSRKRAFGGDDPQPERVAPTDYLAGLDDDRTAPFAAADLTRVRRWRPRQRVILLCRSLLWRKVPARLWSETLVALELPDPFPAPEFEDMTGAQRNDYLADALGVPVNTIHVSLIRWRPQLLRLRFVRGLSKSE